MKISFFILAVSFLILFIINITWAVVTAYYSIIYSVQFVLHDQTLIQSLDTSVYLKWILLADGIWIICILIFAFKRRTYKTDLQLHYLQYEPIENPSICVVIPTYNEENSIGKIVSDLFNQKYVKYVLVIDNNSNDNTVKIAQNNGATVIRKKESKGFSHSYAMGLREALKIDANIIMTTEGDGTYNAYDISKMLPYLDNCDMVIGTRQAQILTQKGNQNSKIHVWGNLLVAKLIQVRYFSLSNIGIINLTDVGCLLRIMRRDKIEKIPNRLTHPNTDETIGGIAIALHFTMLALEDNLRILEIPITFNKRIGISKLESNKKMKGIKYGLQLLWFVLTH